jgi:RNA polymerase sigma-70 factor, ECF subfamily
VIDSASAGQFPNAATMNATKPVDTPLSSPPDPPSPASPDARIERMVHLYFDVVWRSLRRLGVAEATLDDAAQQVFMVAARKLDTIDPAGEKPYLLGVAVRVASDARRTLSRRREVADDHAEARPDPAPTAEELVDQKRARQLLDRVLAGMSMDLRAAFTMFEIEGMSVPEVAAALAIPLGTAASRLRRAREQFHEGVTRLSPDKGARRV